MPNHLPAQPCPSDDALAELLSGAADPEVVVSIREHVARCGRCRKALAAAGEDDADEPLFLRPGARLGRYAIQDVIGVGGMGVVYAAHDTALDRRVALKVLFPTSDSSEDERKWLEREAQAMAQLSHPNVVTIFDVGDAGEYLYLAMELVTGRSLSEWLLQGPETVEIFRSFLAAGRGLAAAHEAGIVHGDFKPSNVLVGDERGVQVTDFGLALRATEPAGPQDAPNGGTPRYLAPERKRGGAPTVVSDVYSYCASLFEAAAGQHPDDDPGFAALESFGESLQTALRHGLVPDPEARASSLGEVLAALQPEPAQTGNIGGWVLAGLGAAAIGGMATWVVVRSDGPCVDVELEFEAVWNPDRRARLREALAGARPGFGAATSDQVDMLLDAYAAEWIAMRRKTCEAALVRREASPELIAQRLQCLKHRKQAFHAVADVLETPGLTRLEEASPMAAELPPLSLCTDDRYTSAAVPPPNDAATASRVEGVQADLARVRALLNAPDHTAARNLANEALDAARLLPYEPLLVEALESSASVYAAQGDYDSALDDANAAYEHADAASRSTAAEVHRRLAQIYENKGDLEAALREARKSLGIATKAFGDDNPAVALYHIAVGLPLNVMGRSDQALAEYERARELLGDGDHALAGALHNAIGAANFQHGNFDEALAAFRRALAVRERWLGPTHPSIAASHSNIGGSLYSTGRFDDALVEMRRALEIWLVSLPHRHPSIATVRTNIGLALYQVEDYEGALHEHRLALSISEAAMGPDHPDVALSHGNVGIALHRLGEREAAATEFRVALAGLERSRGPMHHQVGEARMNLGTILDEMGHREEALAELRAGLSIFEGALPSSHPTLGMAHLNIGVVLRGLGRHDEASSELRQALALRRAALGEEHPAVGSAHMNLGITRYAMGRYNEACDEFRRALEILRDSLPPEHREIGEAAAALAFAADHLGAADEVASALEALDDVIARRPDDPILPAVRRLFDAITGSEGIPGVEPFSMVKNARAVIEQGGHAHFGAIADTWMAERGESKKSE